MILRVTAAMRVCKILGIGTRCKYLFDNVNDVRSRAPQFDFVCTESITTNWDVKFPLPVV